MPKSIKKSIILPTKEDIEKPGPGHYKLAHIHEAREGKTHAIVPHRKRDMFDKVIKDSLKVPPIGYY